MNRTIYCRSRLNRIGGRLRLITVSAAALALGLLTFAPAAQAASPAPSQVRLDAAVDRPVLPAGGKQTVFLRVGLTGFPLESDADRAPLNVAIVLDKSSSMAGDKIAKAREAATAAVERLSPRDVVSIIAYDSTVRIVVPATKASEKESIIRAIQEIQPGGSTALFAGVSKGAAEVRKFLDDQRVNRVVLLSDGLANVGPSAPGDLAELGASLLKEGISVTTIGLGLDFNEDLMTALAMKSDANHYFVENAGDLPRIFDREFGRALSVVAQEITTTIRCAPGVRPVRVLGREGDIDGQTMSVFINNLYSEREKFIIVEIEAPEGVDGAARELATVAVAYDNMKSKNRDQLTSWLEVRYTASEKTVAANENPTVIIDTVTLRAMETNQVAMALRDQGRIAEAKAMYSANNDFVLSNYGKVNSPKLKKISEELEQTQQRIDSEAEWNVDRKGQIEGQQWNMYQ